MRTLIDTGLFALYLATSSFGLYKMKSAGTILAVEFAAGFVFYALGFLWWVVLLMRLPLSVAFPLAAGGLIVITQVTGHAFLHEPLSGMHLTGVAMILAGILLVFIRA